MNVTRYNAKDCSIVANEIYVTGLGEDMVTWSKEEAYFEPVVGAQGDIIKSEINNSIHTLALTVQPTSPQLPLLLELKDSTEPFPIWCVNKKLGITVGGEKANIMEMPEIAFGATASDIEIVFCVFDGEIKAE